MGRHSSGAVKAQTGPRWHGKADDYCRCGRPAASLVYEQSTHTWMWFCGTCGVQEARAE
jgi:hypothetical protein